MNSDLIIVWVVVGLVVSMKIGLFLVIRHLSRKPPKAPED